MDSFRIVSLVTLLGCIVPVAVGCSNADSTSDDQTVDDTWTVDRDASEMSTPDGDSDDDLSEVSADSDLADSDSGEGPTEEDCDSDEMLAEDACLSCVERAGNCTERGATCRSKCDSNDQCEIGYCREDLGHCVRVCP